MKRIVIILDQHIDEPSAAAITALGEFLQAKNYHSLCLEYPMGIPDIEKDLAYTIEQCKELGLKPTLRLLLTGDKAAEIRKIPEFAAGINPKTLMEMDFVKLCNILQRYVSSEHYAQIARWIHDIRPTQHKLELIKHYKAAGCKVDCIDLPLTTTQRTIPHKSAELNEARENLMCDKLTAKIKAGENCIFIVGKFHAPGLISKLGQRGLLEQTVVLDPCSPVTTIVIPGYEHWPQRFAGILHRFFIDPDPAIGIKAHLANISKLLGISTSPKSKPGI